MRREARTEAESWEAEAEAETRAESWEAEAETRAEAEANPAAAAAAAGAVGGSGGGKEALEEGRRRVGGRRSACVSVLCWGADGLTGLKTVAVASRGALSMYARVFLFSLFPGRILLFTTVLPRTTLGRIRELRVSE